MIREHYLRGWFLIDLVSSIPLEIITAILVSLDGGAGDGEGTGLRLLRALRLVRLLRLLRLLKLQRYINILEDALNVKYRQSVIELRSCRGCPSPAVL